MSENFKKDEDGLGEHWLTSWEQQAIDDWDSDSSLEERIQCENDRAKQKLWTSFQNAASTTSKLYTEGSRHRCAGNVSLYVPFQNTASAVTILYKDSLDTMKKCFDLGNQYGQQRRTKEMLQWAKKRKRHTRREELIAYVCGKAPPPRHRSTSSLSRANSRVSVDKSSPRLQSPRLHHVSSDAAQNSVETDELQPFREALALQGLNGAMSSFGIRQSSPSNATNCETTDTEGLSQVGEDFPYNILNEMSRKRTAGNVEHISNDSPTRKRQKLV